LNLGTRLYFWTRIVSGYAVNRKMEGDAQGQGLE
jgi:hypothetical protein